MNGNQLPIGCFIRLEKSGLRAIIDRLKELNYRVVGPTVSEAAIVYDEIESVADLPVGYRDEQEAGTYRLRADDSGSYFGYTVGPHSLKNFLFPPRATVLEGQRIGEGWRMRVPEVPDRPLAILGVRSCDLHALAMQDRIFLDDQFVNPVYQARREGLFVVAVHCEHAAPTCFCTSMGTGPAVTSGFDLTLTELPDHFVLEVGSERGGSVATAAPWTPCSIREVTEAQQVPRRAEREMEQRRRPPPGEPAGRFLDTDQYPRPAAGQPRAPAVGRGGQAVPVLRQLHDGLPDLLLQHRRGGHRPDRRFGTARAVLGYVLTVPSTRT